MCVYGVGEAFHPELEYFWCVLRGGSNQTLRGITFMAHSFPAAQDGLQMCKEARTEALGAGELMLAYPWGLGIQGDRPELNRGQCACSSEACREEPEKGKRESESPVGTMEPGVLEQAQSRVQNSLLMPPCLLDGCGHD